MRGFTTLLIIITCCVISFVSGYDFASKCYYSIPPDTIIKRDTVTLIPDTVCDTVQLGERIVKVEVRGGDTLHRIDTVTVSLPFVQKQYKDSSYSAWVSGYEPALDSIKVFSRTVTVKERVTVKEKSRRWGVFGGVGIGVSERGFTPCVGVGIGYRIF